MTRFACPGMDAFALLDALAVGVVVYGRDLRLCYANARALSMLPVTSDQAFGGCSPDFERRLVDGRRQPIPAEQFPARLVLSSGRPVKGLRMGLAHDGSADVTWFTVDAFLQPGGPECVEGIVVTFTEDPDEHGDISFRDIVDSAQDVILVTEADPLEEPGPRIVYANAAFSRLTGYALQDVVGKSPRFLQREDADPAVRARIRAGLAAGRPVREQIYNYSRYGKGYWLDMHIVPLKGPQGNVAYFAAIERDVTRQRDVESELRQLAYHDALTELPNRRLLLDRLNHSLALAKRSGTHVALLFIDLDKFKQLNDTHGHDAGDLMLVEVARRLSRRLRQTDVVARLGGDEFVVLLDGLGADPVLARSHLQVVLEKIQSALDAPYVLGEIVHEGSASIGVKLVASSDDGDAEQILKEADAAMYAAKHDGSAAPR